jgi:hypothetical protein
MCGIALFSVGLLCTSSACSGLSEGAERGTPSVVVLVARRRLRRVAHACQALPSDVERCNEPACTGSVVDAGDELLKNFGSYELQKRV